jgi:phosphoribosylformylglycinamidine (FGAM) synthase PurS component
MDTRLVVELVYPDNTAYSARLCLEQMGMPLQDLKRFDYYYITSDDTVRDKLMKTDILVNANKHRCFTGIPKELMNGYFHVLVQNSEQDNTLLNILRNRLGININSIQHGTLWSLAIKGSVKEGEYITKKAAEKLLANKHYQEYKII